MKCVVALLLPLLVLAMRTVADEAVYSVGSGQTYASPQAAYDALPSTLVAGRDYLIRIEDAATYGVPGGNTYPIEIDRVLAWGASARIIFTASTHHAEGSGGPLIQASSTYLVHQTAGVTSGTASYIFKGLRFDSTSGSGAVYRANIGSLTYSLRFTECHILRSGANINFDMIRIDDPDVHGTYTIDNCTLIQGSGAVMRAAIHPILTSIASGSDIAIVAYNNLFVGAECGVKMTIGSGSWTSCSFTSRNNVFISTTTPVNDTTAQWTLDRNYEAHTGTGTSGANSDNSITAATFYNTSTWARVSAATPNAIDDDGTSLGAAYERDVDGLIRTGAWSKGGKEFLNNEPPTLSITKVEYDAGGGYVEQSAPYKMLPTDAVRFTGVATDGEDGTISADIVWEYSRNGGAYTSIGTGAAPEWEPPGNDPYTIRAAITDSGALTDTDSVAVTIAPVIANVASGGTVASMRPYNPLTSSASRGVALPLSHSWAQVSGTSATIENGASSTARMTAPYIATTASPEDVVFRVTVSDATSPTPNTDTADVTYSVVVNRQAVIYMANDVIGHLWTNLRTSTSNTVGSRTLYWFPGARPVSGTDYWGGEGGTTPQSPGACFQGDQGTGAVLRGMGAIAKVTGNKEIFRKAELIAETCLFVQESNGPWQDMYCPGGTLKACVTSGGASDPDGDGFGGRQPITGVTVNSTPVNDDGTYSSLVDGLVSLADAKYAWRVTHNTGDDYLRWIDGDASIGSHNGAAAYFARHAELRSNVSRSASWASATIKAGGPSPYASGGIPECPDIQQAFLIDINANRQWQSKVNRYGAYYPSNTLNDDVLHDYLHVGARLYLLLDSLGHSYAPTLRAELQVNCQWLLDRFGDEGDWGWGNSYGIGDTDFLNSGNAPAGVTHIPALHENRTARPQDQRGLAPEENHVGVALSVLHAKGVLDNDGTLKSAVFAAIQKYCDRVTPPGGKQSDGTTVPSDGTTPPGGAVMSYQFISNGGTWELCRYYPGNSDPNAVAAAAALGMASWTPDDRGITTFGADDSLATTWKDGYDLLSALSVSGAVFTSSTTPDTSDPDYNLGFAYGTTAADGQPYHMAWDSTSQCRSVLVNTSTGVLDAAKMLAVYTGAWYGNVMVAPDNMTTVWNAYQPTRHGWTASGDTVYDLGVYRRHMLTIGIYFTSFADSPAIDDYDGDGVVNAADADPYDPAIGETAPAAKTENNLNWGRFRRLWRWNATPSVPRRTPRY